MLIAFNTRLGGSFAMSCKLQVEGLLALLIYDII